MNQPFTDSDAGFAAVLVDWQSHTIQWYGMLGDVTAQPDAILKLLFTAERSSSTAAHALIYTRDGAPPVYYDDPDSFAEELALPAKTVRQCLGWRFLGPKETVAEGDQRWEEGGWEPVPAIQIGEAAEQDLPIIRSFDDSTAPRPATRGSAAGARAFQQAAEHLREVTGHLQCLGSGQPSPLSNAEALQALAQAEAALRHAADPELGERGSRRIFYRSVFEIEVLSDQPLGSDAGLEYIYEQVAAGEFSALCKLILCERVSGKRMAQLLREQGTDPDSFLLTVDGQNVFRAD